MGNSPVCKMQLQLSMRGGTTTAELPFPKKFCGKRAARFSAVLFRCCAESSYANFEFEFPTIY